MYLYFSLARIFAGCEIPFVKLPNSLRTQMRIPFVKLPNSLRENDIYLSKVSEYSFFTYPDPWLSGVTDLASFLRVSEALATVMPPSLKP